jgi:signal peptidase II
VTPKLRFFLASLLVALPSDQGSKAWILAHLAPGERVPVVAGFFDLTSVRNPGGSWSLLADAPVELRLALFVGVALIGIAIGLVFLIRLEPGARLAGAALGLVLGGALGNLVDRLVHGGVVDFLDFVVFGYAWPTFNLADSFIVVGVLLLLIEGRRRADAAGGGG